MPSYVDIYLELQDQQIKDLQELVKVGQIFTLASLPESLSTMPLILTKRELSSGLTCSTSITVLEIHALPGIPK